MMGGARLLASRSHFAGQIPSVTAREDPSSPRLRRDRLSPHQSSPPPSLSLLDVAAGFPDSPPTAPQPKRSINSMKSHIIPVLALGLLASSVSAQDKPDLTNPKQKTSYAIGMDIAASLKRQDLDLDIKALTTGLADGFAGNPALTEEQQKATLMDLQKSRRAKVEEKQKAAAEKNLKAGKLSSPRTPRRTA